MNCFGLSFLGECSQVVTNCGRSDAEVRADLASRGRAVLEQEIEDLFPGGIFGHKAIVQPNRGIMKRKFDEINFVLTLQAWVLQ